MTISDLRSRIADRLLIAGCVIASGCVQSARAVAEAPTTAQPAIDVVELSATDARDRMASGQLTSEALTKAYLDRIAKIDDAGPKLDAVIEINPQSRWLTPPRSTPSARPARCADRCTAFRC